MVYLYGLLGKIILIYMYTIVYTRQVPDLMKHYDWSTVYCERHISIFFIHMETLYIAVRGFKM